MLLKDLDIQIKAHGVFLFANIIIKRNGKFYSVANNMAAETEHIGRIHNEPTIQFINEAIQQFMEHSKKIDESWRVERLKTGDSSRKIMEFEIKL